MSLLLAKRVLLGVGGGIAAYKAPALVRALKAEGAEVRVVLTKAAEAFTTQMTLQVLSGERVATSLLDPSFEHEIGHIELARWADVMLIAPATADLIAKVRAGMADDLLTTLLLATTAPVVIAPSMNTQMLLKEVTQDNLAALRSRAGYSIVEPDSGSLACGEVGAGRQPDPPVLIAHLERALSDQPLRGRSLVVSAGPTREHFDPVRFLSNPSSGKMGYAIAAAAWAAGADVTLISGPTALEPPAGPKLIKVASAAEMRRAVLDYASDILVMAAAVADYTPKERRPHKRKKTAGDWLPEMERTVDIIADVAASAARPRLVIGFAAETEDVLKNASDKLVRKGLDGVVANSVAGPDGAFANDRSELYLLAAGREPRSLGCDSKRAHAAQIIEWIAELGADE